VARQAEVRMDGRRTIFCLGERGLFLRRTVRLFT